MGYETLMCLVSNAICVCKLLHDVIIKRRKRNVNNKTKMMKSTFWCIVWLLNRGISTVYGCLHFLFCRSTKRFLNVFEWGFYGLKYLVSISQRSCTSLHCSDLL
eukprot:TRINITY_DN3952_c0_g1_i2.p1 TRINITY_DN3952_c0_g1~~TRINITY_DN3952_c0_g1_i2.p1  ORF type:complete len:104 (+),score=7.73 TRINITY_DN3952_c0_g1_i2:536-847(+)